MSYTLKSFAIITSFAFIFGLVLGVIFYAGAISGKLTLAQSANQSMQAFRSKVIGSITAFGKVESVSGRVITLSQGGEQMAVRIKNNAEIFNYSSPAGEAPIKTETSISNIKPGDSVNIEISVLPDNRLEGRAVIIFSDLK